MSRALKSKTTDHQHAPTPTHTSSKQIQVFILLSIFVFVFIFIFTLDSQFHTKNGLQIDGIRNSNFINKLNEPGSFFSMFEETLFSNDLPTMDLLVPLILSDGKLLCRASHKGYLAKSRIRSFVEIVQTGTQLDSYTKKSNSTSESSQPTVIHSIESDLPILINPSDSNNCNISCKAENVSIPRLSWFIVAPKYGQWCHAIGVPSYANWARLRKFKDESQWQRHFKYSNKHYPWATKINKAIWRGSTTYNSIYRYKPFTDIPRTQLVEKGLKNPELIDAGFHHFIQKFENATASGYLASKIKMNDMQRFKGMTK